MIRWGSRERMAYGTVQHRSAGLCRMTHSGQVSIGEQLLAEVEAIAERAGEVILGYYKGVIAQRAKADASPVTAADEAAEAVIVPALQALTPEVPVVSEEAVAAGHIPEVHGPGNPSKRFWLVDPLDGTKEFISRNGEFTVNIALVEEGRPTLGVVFAPAMDTLWRGAAGLGAGKRVGSAEFVSIRTRQPPRHGLTACASRSHGVVSDLDTWFGNAGLT